MADSANSAARLAEVAEPLTAEATKAATGSIPPESVAFASTVSAPDFASSFIAASTGS